MAFELKGFIEGMEAHIRWDGHSYATRRVMELYRGFLRTKQGEFLGFLPDAGTAEDHDRCAPAAYAAWMHVFDEITERTGDFPWEAHKEGEVY